jgi:2-dehydropantoate 2-reductase
VVDLVTPALPKTNTHTTLVLLQNGLHIYRPFLETHPQTTVLSGISMIGSEEVSPGKIIQDEGDKLIIGAFPNPNNSPTSAGLDFVNMYKNGGKTYCKLSADVVHDRWRKLVYNACLNPICAILGLDTGRLRLAADGGVMERLVRPAMQEIVEAAKANGVVLDGGVVQKMIDADPLQSYLSPSMLSDVNKGNFIEHENLLGEPLREGKKAGVEMPTIEMLYYLAKGIQWRTMEKRGLVDVPPKNV